MCTNCLKFYLHANNYLHIEGVIVADKVNAVGVCSSGNYATNGMQYSFHHLQGLGLMACSDLPVRRIDPSISLVVNFYLFFL
jgi:hypothetical protein